MRRAPVLLLLLLALAAAPGAARAAAPFDPLHAAAIDGRPGAQVPMRAPIRDAQGRPTTLAALGGGRPILLAPVQHHCPNLCGYTLDGLAQRLRETGLDRQAAVVALGIDPKETPADAQASAARLRGLADAHAVVGAPAQIAALTGALGYRYAWDPRLGQYAHLAAVAVLTPDGRLSSWLYGVQPPAPVLRAAVRAAGRGGLAALGERITLLCYHYDPQTGRYDSRIALALKLGAAAVALALAAFVALSLRGEKRRARR
jgi:protein SCO1/2